jgi:DNA helicase-2/ATP-dependent DNA helicase PcrA
MLLRGAARGAADPGEEPETIPQQVRAVLSSRGWASEPPTGSGAVRDRWESLAALVRLSEDFSAARPTAELSDFVTELDERANAQHAPTVEGVTLASLHAAKGLEWDAVFLVGLTEGTMPITHAKTDEQVEEERRLLYVGVTRARLHLSLSWALSRSPGGRGGRRPSRFMDGLRPGSAPRGGRGGAGGQGGVERGSGGRTRRRGPVLCRVCGRTLSEAGEIKLMRCEDCPSDLDEALYDRLRGWRMEQAKALGQPAYCVFTDKTLLAIAEVRPSDEQGLSAIPGVGARKLDKFGTDVLALCTGVHPGEAGENEEYDAPDEVPEEGPPAEPEDVRESSSEEAEK